MVGVRKNGELIGVIGLDDPIRKESREMVADLRKVGVQHIALVTGDREETAKDVASSVGITEIYSKVTSEGKMQIALDAMKIARGSVIVVGDGINDAPALAVAHVGVAMGARGASAASEAADVVIVEDSIERLTRAITIAKISKAKAIQAAGIGMALSFIAILWALTALKSQKFGK